MLGLTKSLLRNELRRVLGVEAPAEGGRHVVDIASDRVEIDVRETLTTSTPKGPRWDPWGIEVGPGVDQPADPLTHTPLRFRLTGPLGSRARCRPGFEELDRYTALTGGAMFKQRGLWADRR